MIHVMTLLSIEWKYLPVTHLDKLSSMITVQETTRWEWCLHKQRCVSEVEWGHTYIRLTAVGHRGSHFIAQPNPQWLGSNRSLKYLQCLIFEVACIYLLPIYLADLQTHHVLRFVIITLFAIILKIIFNLTNYKLIIIHRILYMERP